MIRIDTADKCSKYGYYVMDITLTCDKCGAKIFRKVEYIPDDLICNIPRNIETLPLNAEKLNDILNAKLIHVCDKENNKFGIASVTDVDISNSDVNFDNIHTDDYLGTLRLNIKEESYEKT